LAQAGLEGGDEPGGRGDRRDRGRAPRDLGRGADGGGKPHPAHSRVLVGQIALALAFVLGALLIGGCAYLTEKQGELIFRPTKEAWRGFDASRGGFSEQWIPVGTDGQKINGWWLPAANAKAPALLYLHGARWNLTGSVTRIERWRQLGFSVLAVDYRGFGKSSDVAPTEEYAYEDAEAAWRALGKLAPGKPKYIVGHSLGGAIAAELARRHPDAAGLVLEATFTSVGDMIDQSPWGFLPVGLILTQKFDTLSRMREVHVPVIITHGTRDSVVPFHMGERLFAAANEPKRFVRVEGAGHHNLSGAGNEAYRSALREVFGVTRNN
jgi:alpha-beta hydrolase superfamily lysophospholipase